MFLDRSGDRFQYSVALFETPLQRALAEAPVQRAPEAPRSEREYFVFRVGDAVMGVRSEHVREVTRMSSLTPLPRSPAFVLGVVGHRGEVFPLIDLLRFLGHGAARVAPRSRLFVTLVGGSVVGFLVESVAGLRRVADAEMLPPPAGPSPGLEHIEGLCQSRVLGSLMLLDLPSIIAAARRRLVSR